MLLIIQNACELILDSIHFIIAVDLIPDTCILRLSFLCISIFQILVLGCTNFPKGLEKFSKDEDKAERKILQYLQSFARVIFKFNYIVFHALLKT